MEAEGKNTARERKETKITNTADVQCEVLHDTDTQAYKVNNT